MGELKLATVLDRLLQDVDTLGVGQSDEVLLDYRLERGDKLLVDHLVEELQVVAAVIQGPVNAILDEVLLEVHQSLLVEEGHLGSTIQNSARWRGVLLFSARKVGPKV